MAQKSLNKLTSKDDKKHIQILPKTVQKLTMSIMTSKRLILNVEKLLKVFKIQIIEKFKIASIHIEKLQAFETAKKK